MDEGIEVSIVAKMTYDLDATGLREMVMVRFTDYTAQVVCDQYLNADTLRQQWSDPAHRAEIMRWLLEQGIDFERMLSVMNQTDSDRIDLLCKVDFSAPIRTHRERANLVRLEETDFFSTYTGRASEVLEALLEQYIEHGITEFSQQGLVDVDTLKIAPFSNYGTISEIARIFGGADQLCDAVEQL